ncbi:MAG TPA: gas vesicle protein K [Longimicrobiales bacterium]|nr:gas vesicle protein K [Longimicrobiales bacterium]
MTDSERPSGGGSGVPGGDGESGPEPTPEPTPSAGLRQVAPALPERIDASPEDIEAGVGKLVLTLIEFLRQVLEHQAVRRMEGGGLSDEEMERLGLALMRLEERLDEIRDTFGIDRDDLNIDLGPLGQLL